MKSVASLTSVKCTERSLSERIAEHQKSIDKGDMKYALTQHQVQTGHKISSTSIREEVNIIDQDRRQGNPIVK